MSVNLDSLIVIVIVITTESASKDTLEKVMSEALSKSGSNWSAVRAVCLGVSGVNHPTDQDRIIHWLRYGAVLFTIYGKFQTY